MLRVTALGHFGGYPELRYSQKGAPIFQFRIGVDQVRTGRGGQREESTE
jgi:single-stranded DNA-binding protein